MSLDRAPLRDGGGAGFNSATDVPPACFPALPVTGLLRGVPGILPVQGPGGGEGITDEAEFDQRRAEQQRNVARRQRRVTSRADPGGPVRNRPGYTPSTLYDTGNHCV